MPLAAPAAPWGEGQNSSFPGAGKAVIVKGQEDSRVWQFPLWDFVITSDYPRSSFSGDLFTSPRIKVKEQATPPIIMKTMEPGNVYILWNDENLLPEAGQESSGNDAAAKDTGEKEFGINSEQTAPDKQQIPQKPIIWGFH